MSFGYSWEQRTWQWMSCFGIVVALFSQHFPLGAFVVQTQTSCEYVFGLVWPEHREHGSNINQNLNSALNVVLASGKHEHGHPDFDSIVAYYILHRLNNSMRDNTNHAQGMHTHRCLVLGGCIVGLNIEQWTSNIKICRAYNNCNMQKCRTVHTIN